MATRRKTATRSNEAASPPGPAFAPPGAPPGATPGVEPNLENGGEPAQAPPPAFPAQPPQAPLPPAPPAPPPKTAKRRTRKPSSTPTPPRLTVTETELNLAPDLSQAELKIIFSDGNFGPFNLYELTPEVQLRAAAFGIEQKIRKSRHPVDVGKAIATGTWPEGRVGSTAARVPLVVQAVARLQGIDTAAAYTAWKALPDDGPGSKKTVRGDQRVKGAIAQIKAEQEKSGVDMSTLFGGGPTRAGGAIETS